MVGVGQGAGDRRQHLADASWADRLAGGNLRQRRPVHQLVNHIRRTILHTTIKQPDECRMPQLRQHRRTDDEALARLRVERVPRGQHTKRDGLEAVLILGLEKGAEAAASELGPETVAARDDR